MMKTGLFWLCQAVMIMIMTVTNEQSMGGKEGLYCSYLSCLLLLTDFSFVLHTVWPYDIDHDEDNSLVPFSDYTFDVEALVVNGDI